MDFFQHPRYRHVRLCLSLIGLWPYQAKIASRFFLALPICCTGSLVVTQVFLDGLLHRMFIQKWGNRGFKGLDLIRALIRGYKEPKTLIAAVAPLMVDIGCAVKVLNNILNDKKVKQILEHIKEDFSEKMGPEEEVFLKYAENGRIFSLIYAVTLYSAMVLYLILPSTSKIMVGLGLSNASASAQFPFPVDHNVDPDEYYAYIQIHVCLGVFFVVSMIVAVDCLFVVAVEHACGIFSRIGYRLERVAETEHLNFDLYPLNILDKNFSTVINCIEKHQQALHFVKLLESTYSMAFLMVTGITMVVLTFSLFEALDCIAKGYLEMAGIHMLFAGGQLMHLFFESYCSQRVTDHSMTIYKALNMIQWYKTSLRTRRLLNFMILRCITPCEMKAGTIYVMSIQNFSTVVRTAMSYFTVLSSQQ